MRRRKRSPKRSMDCRMRGTSAMSMPVPTIIFSVTAVNAAVYRVSGELFERTGSSVVRDEASFDLARSLNDTCKSGGQPSILLWKNRAQIQQHAAFFHPSNDRRIGSSQPRREFVSAKTFDGDGQNPCGQRGRWRGPAAENRFTVHNFNFQF